MSTAGRTPVTWPAGVLQRDLWARLAVEGALRAPASQTRALRLTGAVDTERLLVAVGEVVAATEILSAVVDQRDGVPVMAPGACPPQVRVHDAAGVCPAERATDAQQLLRAERDRPVDPAAGPLVRFDVVRLGDGDTVLAATGHALVCDLHSLYTVLGAVMVAYFGRFRPADHPPFARTARDVPRQDPAALEPRRRWWRERLGAAGPAPVSRLPAALPRQDASVRGAPAATAARVRTGAHVGGRDWQGLTALSRPVGGNSWLAVMALAAHWWLRALGPLPPLGCMLDVRQVAAIGEVVGPLSDRVVFFPELDAQGTVTLERLLLRMHAGLLDAVVHHLPYGALRALAREHAAGADPLEGQLFAHYCPVPRSSDTTRGEATLARRGMSIELFADAALAGRGPGHGGWEQVAWDLAVAEDGAGVALTLDRPAAGATSLDGLPEWLAGAVAAVVADPLAPLPDP